MLRLAPWTNGGVPGPSLTSGLYPDRGMRVVSNIDLLVPVGRSDDANRLLLECGFVPAGLGTREHYRHADIDN